MKKHFQRSIDRFARRNPVMGDLTGKEAMYVRLNVSLQFFRSTDLESEPGCLWKNHLVD